MVSFGPGVAADVGAVVAPMNVCVPASGPLVDELEHGAQARQPRGTEPLAAAPFALQPPSAPTALATRPGASSLFLAQPMYSLPSPFEDSQPSGPSAPSGPVGPPGPGTLPPREHRPAPNLVSHPRHIQDVTLDGQAASLTPSLDAVANALRIGNLYNRPGLSLHPPFVNPHPQPLTVLAPYGLVYANAIYLPSVPANLACTLFLDGSASSAQGTFVENGMSNGVGVVLANGLTGLTYNLNVVQGTTLLTLGIQLFFWKDFVRTGAVFVNSIPAAGTFYLVGALGVVAARRNAVDLGEYIGEDATELACAHGIDYARDGMRRIEINQLRAGTLLGRVGGGTFTTALLGRLDVSKGTQLVYRTMVTRQRAHDILFEGHGISQFVRDKLRALRLKKEIMPIPDQHDPDSFKPGDEVIVTKSGSFTVGVVVGNLMVWAGAQLFVRGDVEVAVHKLSDKLMEVTYNPTKIRDGSGYIYSPLGPEIDGGKGGAQSFRQSFVFDLNEPEGLEAYHAAIDGKLPCQLHKFTSEDATASADQKLRDLVLRENALLPKGVSRSYVHLILAQQSRVGGGAHWGLIPQELLPKRWSVNLAVHSTKVQEQQTITDGHTIDSMDSKSCERRAELVFWGEHTLEVSAQQRWLADETTPRHFQGITLRATLLDSRAHGMGYNRSMIGRINRTFNTDFAKFLLPGKSQSREIDLTRVLHESAVEQLARYGALWSQDTSASPLPPISAEDAAVIVSRVEQIAADTDVSAETIVAMLVAVHDAADTQARATVIQEFARQRGLRGFGVLHRLVPDTAGDLHVATLSSVYTDALHQGDKLTLLYLHPVGSNDLPEDICKRYRDVEGALDQVACALYVLADDDLVPDSQRKILQGRLLTLQQDLIERVQVDPVFVPAVRAYTESKLHVRDIDQRMLYFLEPPTAWMTTVEQLLARYQGVPMPRDKAGLLTRYNEVHNVALGLRRRIAWLESTNIFSDARRAAQLNAYRRAVQDLEGDIACGAAADVPLRGVLDFGELSFAERQALLDSLSTFVSNERALSAHIARVHAGPCYALDPVLQRVAC